MSLLSKAGVLLKQAANRQSSHHAICFAPSMGCQEPFRGLTDQQSVRTACTKSGEVEGKTFLDSHKERYTGLGFTTSGLIRPLKVQLAANSIVDQRRSFSSGATGNTAGGISSTRLKPDKAAASYLSKLPVYSHLTSGIENIMADYVHQKMTKEFFSLCFSLFFFIIVKDFIVFLVFP